MHCQVFVLQVVLPTTKLVAVDHTTVSCRFRSSMLSLRKILDDISTDEILLNTPPEAGSASAEHHCNSVIMLSPNML